MSHLPVNTLLQGGKYRIIRFIGSGGFGCTYEAEHVVFESRVAIKEFFAKDFCNRDETTARVTVGTTSKKGLVEKLRRKFVDEARALHQLQHPGIVRVSDVFEENGTAYYVMDYIDGPSLADLVERDGPLPEARAVSYIRQVCAALQYVHSHNRLHLDIKPANIMVDGEGRAILIDFGVSKQYDEYAGENNSTLLGKTPGYAPLEQIFNDVTRFLPATDIYALGATLYKLLTGETPPAANRLASGDKLPPLPDSVSEVTCNAVFAAMRQNKAERPQSVAEFLAILDGEGASEPEVTIVEEPAVPLRPEPGTKTTLEPVEPEPAVASPRKKNRIVMYVTASLAVVVGIWLLATQIGFASFEHKNQQITGTINGHDYVDLGLSVKWATCNVGASLPSDYSNYYAWGEVLTKSEYRVDNSKTYGKSYGDIGGSSSTDAARANWGGTWRLPTKSECDELVNKCSWIWTTMNGKNGYRVTGSNGNSIFLPAVGYRYGSSLSSVGSYGYYWSSMPYESGSYLAYGLYFDSGDHDVGWDVRNDGRSVRPVSK